MLDAMGEWPVLASDANALVEANATFWQAVGSRFPIVVELPERETCTRSRPAWPVLVPPWMPRWMTRLPFRYWNALAVLWEDVTVWRESTHAAVG